ncbi:NADH-dependent flavin oxidoreductase [Prolixibacter sp. SD074]|uniref:NADH-dependent flavin oxidoreductase n=1 Tax=Prolixibacter sp. SD074 TaxID=2652391 RepID=UPI0012991E51|nr:NADH-dependent flavin oxidoreductase [Prolixibacter sp. SD074]
MNPKYASLWEPFRLPVSGIELKNRIMMAPMTTWSGNLDGTVSDAELNYYKKRSGGVGVVATACAFIMPEGKGFSGQIGAHSDAMLPSLKRLAETIQQEGAKAILQIYHGGRMCPPNEVPGGQPLSASAVAAEREGAAVPRAMAEEEILSTIKAYGNATHLAILAGFDGVEIHGANTYLVQQFFSPHSNRRTDVWGGTLEKRMKFPLAVVDEVLQNVKQYAKSPFAVGYRLSPEEMEEPGITMEDTLQLVDALAKKPLDYLHISTMNLWDGSMRDASDKRSRTLLIQERVGNKIPVIGVGSLHTPDDVLKVVEEGNLPLVALGRELLMEPEWVQKAQNGSVDKIRTTLSVHDQNELVIPDNLWHGLISRKGWLPVIENE